MTTRLELFRPSAVSSPAAVAGGRVPFPLPRHGARSRAPRPQIRTGSGTLPGLCSSIFLPLLLVLCCFGCTPSGREPQVGDPAPPFILQDLNGNRLSFSSSDQRPRLLYFWADWCPDCENDFRLMERLYRSWRENPASPRLVAVNVGQDNQHIIDFIKKLQTTFPVWLDRDGRVARLYGIRILPTFILVDRDGRIRSIIPGWIDEETIQRIRNAPFSKGAAAQTKNQS